MSIIKKAFNEYKLGEINSDKLNDHFCHNQNINTYSDENRDTYGND